MKKLFFYYAEKRKEIEHIKKRNNTTIRGSNAINNTVIFSSIYIFTAITIGYLFRLLRDVSYVFFTVNILLFATFIVYKWTLEKKVQYKENVQYNIAISIIMDCLFFLTIQALSQGVIMLLLKQAFHPFDIIFMVVLSVIAYSVLFAFQMSHVADFKIHQVHTVLKVAVMIVLVQILCLYIFQIRDVKLYYGASILVVLGYLFLRSNINKRKRSISYINYLTIVVLIWTVVIMSIEFKDASYPVTPLFLDDQIGRFEIIEDNIPRTNHKLEIVSKFKYGYLFKTDLTYYFVDNSFTVRNTVDANGIIRISYSNDEIYILSFDEKYELNVYDYNLEFIETLDVKHLSENTVVFKLDKERYATDIGSYHLMNIASENSSLFRIEDVGYTDGYHFVISSFLQSPVAFYSLYTNPIYDEYYFDGLYYKEFDDSEYYFFLKEDSSHVLLNYNPVSERMVSMIGYNNNLLYIKERNDDKYLVHNKYSETKHYVGLETFDIRTIICEESGWIYMYDESSEILYKVSEKELFKIIVSPEKNVLIIISLFIVSFLFLFVSQDEKQNNYRPRKQETSNNLIKEHNHPLFYIESQILEESIKAYDERED